MKRALIFASRNAKEILRDPLSYLFCLGFPVVMLIVMTAVNSSIPPQAEMHVFEIANLAPAIGIFGLMFVTLFAALLISKDRTGAFLIRLYSSPMKAADFIWGYLIALLAIAAAQLMICMTAAYIVSLATGNAISPANLLLCCAVSLVSAVLMSGTGIIFGSILSDKAAPGLCSLIISAGSMLGGIFMDVDAMGGTILKICKALPFYHCVRAARAAVSGEFGEIGKPLAISAIYAAVILLIAVIAFGRKMKADLK